MALAEVRVEAVEPMDNESQARPEELRLLEALLFASSEPLDAATLAKRMPEGVDVNKLLAAAKTAPELATIEWDGDRSRVTPAALAPLEFTPSSADTVEEAVEVMMEFDVGDFDVEQLDPRRRKIRERYVAARFPGVARTLADLHSSDRVIKAARLCFEDEQPELALELLEIAAQFRLQRFGIGAPIPRRLDRQIAKRTDARTRPRRVLLADPPAYLVVSGVQECTGVEGQRSGAELVQQHAKRVDVGARVNVRVQRVGLLRTHVGRSADDRAVLGEECLFNQTRRRRFRVGSISRFSFLRRSANRV